MGDASATGQTMRVVATNVGIAPATASAVAIPACGVDVKFFDSDGKQVGLGGHTDSLAPGESFAIELPGPTAAGRAEFRTQVQIVIPTATSTTGSVLTRLMVCNILSTVQVYDASTGKTDFAVTGSPVIMSYMPGPPLCQKGDVCAQ